MTEESSTYGNLGETMEGLSRKLVEIKEGPENQAKEVVGRTEVSINLEVDEVRQAERCFTLVLTGPSSPYLARTLALYVGRIIGTENDKIVNRRSQVRDDKRTLQLRVPIDMEAELLEDLNYLYEKLREPQGKKMAEEVFGLANDLERVYEPTRANTDLRISQEGELEVIINKIHTNNSELYAALGDFKNVNEKEIKRPWFVKGMKVHNIGMSISANKGHEAEFTDFLMNMMRGRGGPSGNVTLLPGNDGRQIPGGRGA